MTVYVVQENPKLNYVDAERFGEIRFVTATEYSPISNSLKNKELLLLAAQTMEKFDPDEDYLLLTGSPVLLGYLFHLAISKKGYINILQWDAIKQKYLLIPFKPQTQNKG